MSRFAEPQHPAFRAIHFSIDFDQRLWPQDLRGSRAHVRMLAAADIISALAKLISASTANTRRSSEEERTIEDMALSLG